MISNPKIIMTKITNNKTVEIIKPTASLFNSLHESETIKIYIKNQYNFGY